MKKLLFLILLLLTAGDSMAQLKMKEDWLNESPMSFMKKHPDYIFLNMPFKPNNYGFHHYFISETLNPAAVGLKNNNYYIILESFDAYGNYKPLIPYSNEFRSRLFYKMNTSSQRVVFFIDTDALFENNLLDLVKDDDGWHYKYYLKYGLSADGRRYAGNTEYTTMRETISNYVYAKAETTWTLDAGTTQSTCRNKRKNAGDYYLELQPSTALSGAKGCLFEVKVPSYQTRTGKKVYNVTFRPKLALYKDENYTQLVKTIDLGTVYDNPRDTYIYYLLDNSVMKSLGPLYTTTSGRKFHKLYYIVRLNEQYKPVPAHVLYTFLAKGSIELEASKHEHDLYNTVEFYMDTKQKRIGRYDEYADTCSTAIGQQRVKLEKVKHPDVDMPNFYISDKPITKGMWAAVMGEKDTHNFSPSDDEPFSDISYLEATKFIKALNELEKERGGTKEYFLPSSRQLIQKGIFKAKEGQDMSDPNLDTGTTTTAGLFISAYDYKPCKKGYMYKTYYVIHVDLIRYCKGCSYSDNLMSDEYDGGTIRNKAYKLMNDIADSFRSDPKYKVIVRQ